MANFMFEGSIDIDVPIWGPSSSTVVSASRLTNDSFKGWIYGGVDFAMDFGLFEIQFTLAALCGQTSKSRRPARSAELEVTVAGLHRQAEASRMELGPAPSRLLARKAALCC
jgi:hypothetical protein